MYVWNALFSSLDFQTHFPEAIGLERLGFFPKPQISENATLIDLVIQNFTFTLTGSDDDDDDDDTKASRLALEVIIIHGAQVNNGSSTLDEYLDDEYTPSIFSSWSYNVSGKDTQEFEDMGGYVHWKPISYQDGSRKSTISQQVNVVVAGDSQECILESIPKGLARALFGEQVDSLRVSNITRWFVVFGTEGDDDFFSPEYSTW